MKKVWVLAGLCLFLQPAFCSAVILHPTVHSRIMKNIPGLSINFISKGAGIDHESFDKIEQYLKDHPKKPSYTVNSYGKEGEKMIHVNMTGLSKKEQKALEKAINELIVKKDMVQVKKVKKIRAAF